MLRFLLYLKGYGVQKCDYKYFWLVGAPAGALFFLKNAHVYVYSGRGPGIDISILDTGVIDIQRGPIHFRFLHMARPLWASWAPSGPSARTGGLRI